MFENVGMGGCVFLLKLANESINRISFLHMADRQRIVLYREGVIDV